MLANSRGIWFAHRNSRGASEFESANMSDLDRQIEQLKRCETLKESEVKALCLKAMEILVEEGNVQRVDAPVIVSIEELVLTIPPPPPSMRSHGFGCFYCMSFAYRNVSSVSSVWLNWVADAWFVSVISWIWVWVLLGSFTRVYAYSNKIFKFKDSRVWRTETSFTLSLNRKIGL